MTYAPHRTLSRAWQLTAAGLAVLLTASLAACSADSTSLSANVATASTTPEGGGGAYDTVKTAEETAQSGPGIVHPFSDPNDRETGGRQVIESPTLAEVLEPGALPEIVIGRADAPVTIVEYASLTCPHCAKFHKEVLPDLKREYLDTGKVRLIFREFPIGKTSGLATITMRCAKPEKQVELIGKYMAQQDKWVSQEVRPDPVFDVAKQVGMTRAEFDACRQNQSIIEALKAIKERGRKLGIIGTPNFFVMEKRVKSTLTMADIRAMVDPLLQQGARPAATAQR
ncbi:MAG: DsbA family protein [Hyphomicrobiaceae bacterium]|nr:DsbA family protein [Hyphomicrobiaceae bacterium]